MRRALRSELGRAIAVDAFVWTRGEPPCRQATKFGGLPYWPTREPWPTIDARPLLFVAQILVAPSRDLFPDALGDVLLFFVDPASDWQLGDRMLAAWVSATDEPLVERVPADPPFRPCWAQRLRTEDHPDAPRRGGDAWRVAVVEGTKLGGARVYVQPDEDIGPEEVFRGALGSISAHESWPFCDAEHMTRAECFAEPPIGWCWGDMGSIRILSYGAGGRDLVSGFY